MKKKDLVLLVIAAVIIMGTIFVAYTLLLPKKSSANKGVTVDKVGIIKSDLDTAGLTALTNPKISRDFNSPVDLSGLNNTAPFGN